MAKMKKVKWLVSVDSLQYKSVISELKRLKCEVHSELETIHVIVIYANEKDILKFKKINGILAIEREGQVSI